MDDDGILVALSQCDHLLDLTALFPLRTLWQQTIVRWLSVLALGSSLSTAAFVRLGSSLSVESLVRLQRVGELSVQGMTSLGSSLSIRGLVRLVSDLSVVDRTRLGITLSVSNVIQSGSLVWFSNARQLCRRLSICVGFGRYIKRRCIGCRAC
jgi:hypothetical protein